MEHSQPTADPRERTDYEQADYYLPAMPSDALVSAIQRLVAGLDRSGRDDS